MTTKKRRSGENSEVVRSDEINIDENNVDESRESNRLSWYIVIWIVLVFCFQFSALLPNTCYFEDVRITLPDIIELFSTTCVIPVYWKLFQVFPGKPARYTEREVITFLLFCSLWIMGTGIHLGANSLDHVLKEHKTKVPVAYRLNYFYDEQLGHHLQASGLNLLALLMLYRQMNNPFKVRRAPSKWREIFAGAVYSFCVFAWSVEGQTVHLGIPYCIAVFLIVLIYRGGRGGGNGTKTGKQQQQQQQQQSRPLATFYVTGAALTLIQLGVWCAMNGGRFPEFSETLDLWDEAKYNTPVQ